MQPVEGKKDLLKPEKKGLKPNPMKKMKSGKNFIKRELTGHVVTRWLFIFIFKFHYIDNYIIKVSCTRIDIDGERLYCSYRYVVSR